MTDFLGRIAARAVGEAPLALPRLPSLFERAGAETIGRGIVDEQVVVPAPAREVQAGVTKPPARDAQPREPQAPFGTQDVAREHEDRVAASVPTASDPRAEFPKPSDTLSLGGLGEAPAFPPAPAPSPSSSSLERSSAAVAASVVPAAAAKLDVPFPGPGAPATPPAPDETPTVRVHIGRLEVRANLQDAAPPSQLRPVESGPQRLSLGDYLRGKREAG